MIGLNRRRSSTGRSDPCGVALFLSQVMKSYDRRESERRAKVYGEKHIQST
jgi:hypothetical protein